MKRWLHVLMWALLVPQVVYADPSEDGRKVADLLKALIRFDTSNAPGDTGEIARYLRQQFEPLGAQVDIISAPNGKATHFIARIKGDGSKKPILLAAHADVVPVEKEKWKEEPFSGVEKGGFIYGRGAMDFKGGMAVFARAVMKLAEDKVPLARDVIFLAEADEEQGQYNTSWLAREHWDKMDCEFALNEGGYVWQRSDGSVRQINVTTVEKLSVTFSLRTTGKSGHSSRPFPPDESANARLVTALAKLAHYDTPVKLVPDSRRYFEALVPLSDPPTAGLLRQLLDASTQAEREEAGRRLAIASDKDGLLMHALLRDTLVITILRSGFKANVIPGDAEAIINTRLLPGTTTDELLAEIRRAIDDPAVEIKIVSPLSQEDAVKYYLMRTRVPATPVNTTLYRAMEANAEKVWRGAKLVPTMFEAGTDATAWRERGVPVYGIYPYPVNDDVVSRMHGNDEKVRVQSLAEGFQWLYGTLLDVARK